MAASRPSWSVKARVCFVRLRAIGCTQPTAEMGAKLLLIAHLFDIRFLPEVVGMLADV